MKFLIMWSFFIVASCQPGGTTPNEAGGGQPSTSGDGTGISDDTQKGSQSDHPVQLIVDGLVDDFIETKARVSKRQVLLDQTLDRSRLLKSDLTVAISRGCWADADLGDVELILRAKKLDDKLVTDKLNVTPGEEDKGNFESGSQPGTFIISLGSALDPITLTGGISSLKGRTLRLDALRGKTVADLKNISIYKAVSYLVDESSRQCSRSFWESLTNNKGLKCYAPAYETDIYRLEDVHIRYRNLTTGVEKSLYKLEGIDERLDVQNPSWKSPIQMNRLFINAMREQQCTF